MDALELWMYLWHWSPRKRRESIEREGLRRCTWQGRRLVCWSAELGAAQSLKKHIATQHAVAVRQLDGWLVQVLRGWSSPMRDGSHAILHDVPRQDLRRMHVIPVSQAEALWYMRNRNNAQRGIKA